MRVELNSGSYNMRLCASVSLCAQGRQQVLPPRELTLSTPTPVHYENKQTALSVRGLLYAK